METIGFLDPVRSALVTSRDTRRTIRVKRADDALNSGIFSRMGASFSARSAGYLGVIFDVADAVSDGSAVDLRRYRLWETISWSGGAPRLVFEHPPASSGA